MELLRARPWARILLAGLLSAMAAGQLSDPGGFADIMSTYGIGGATVASVVAAALVGGELLAAVGLVSKAALTRRRAASLALAVAVAWSLLGTQAFLRGLDLDNCGCFGVHLAQPLRWWVLVQDLEFMALAWWVRFRRVGTPARRSEERLEAPVR